MRKYEYGNHDSSNILIQMVDDHDLAVIESEVSIIKDMAGDDFRLIAFKVNDWNKDLSPWEAPSVFGNEGFICRSSFVFGNDGFICRSSFVFGIG